MRIRPIVAPLPGESVLAVQPTLSPEPEVTWNRRLNLHSGRTLSDIALATEQAERAGRLALRGQVLAPGVIDGLEAGLERQLPAGEGGNPGNGVAAFVHVSPGTGLAASGELVTLPQPLRVHTDLLPVYAPVSVLDGGPLPGLGEPVVRALGPNLGQAIAHGLALPRAGVLVLQPIVAELTGNANPADPCAVDADAEAFADRQWVDGCRLIFFAWPTEVLPLPDPGPAWRNRLAYALFERERFFAAGQLWPWQALGVPVAVLALDDAQQPQFVDRGAVVRLGGKARRRKALLPGGGSLELRQARIQQFAEQVTELTAQGLGPADLAGEFHYLPPVGLLPTTALDLAARTSLTFPATYALSVQPLPLEQVDVALTDSAALAPLHVALPAQVELFVPVPQQYFDPRLLTTEVVDAEFPTTIATLATVRAEKLLRRLTLRRIFSRLQESITGKPITYPDPDPGALESPEPMQTDPLDPPEVEATYGVQTPTGDNVPVTDADGNPLLSVLEMDALRAFLLSPSTPLTEPEVTQLDALGLQGFITMLDSRIRGANDTIDFSFLRVQTDIYRIRQRILGTAEATRLATSPVLAAIAKGESAYATRQDLEVFAAGLRVAAPAAPAPAVAAPQPGAAPAPTPEGAPAPQAAPLLGAARTDLFVAGSGLGVVGSAGGHSAILTGLQPVTRPVIDTTFTGVQGTGIQGTGIQGTGIQGELGAAALRSDLLTSPTFDTTMRVDVSPALLAGLETSPVANRGLLETGVVVLRPPTTDDITQQAPIVGQVYDFRTVAIAERGTEPPSGESRSAAIATKVSTITAIQEIGLNVADVQVPGFLDANNQLTRLHLKDISANTLGEILGGVHDPVSANDRNEATFFNSAVKALENTVAVLRGVEGRIQAYRTILDRCRASLAVLQGQAAAADRRLKQLDDELAEARHDVAVAKALLAEETQRIDGINARRAAILRDHVPFLVYRRPRVAQTVLPTPARVVDAGFAQPVVAACLDADSPIPAELQRLVELMRRAPLRWFVDLPPLLDLLDRQPSLLAALQAARTSALYRQFQVTPQVALPFAGGFVPPLLASQSNTQVSAQVTSALGRVYAAQQQSVLQVQTMTAALNLGDFAGLSWQNLRERARVYVTVGDLLEGAHGNSVLAQRAAAALDDIAHVAACLHATLSGVPALLRLAWAELLSQYDAPVGLRNLANLPRWDEIPARHDRRELQTLVDWLFARIDPNEPDAVALVNDLVRVCILLASHAPVNQVIAGALHEPATVRPGGLIKIAIDPAYVRVGMPVFIYKNQEVVAQAVVSDLAGGIAAASITAATAVVQLDKGARVQFGAAFQ